MYDHKISQKLSVTHDGHAALAENSSDTEI